MMGARRRSREDRKIEEAMAAAAVSFFDEKGRTAGASSSREGDPTGLIRLMVLEALFERWSDPSGPGRTGIASLLPQPPREPSGFFNAVDLFCFAERAEALMNFEVRREGREIEIRRSMRSRKARGVYFTPYELAVHMVDACLAPVLASCQGPVEDLLKIRVLDPAMGTGRFLLAAAERIAGEAAAGDPADILDLRRRVTAQCLFGVDRSGFAVAAARFLLGLYGGIGRGAETPNLRKGDALVPFGPGRQPGGDRGFPEAFFPEGAPFDGFDAIVGNPPYVANKNEPSSFPSLSGEKSGKPGQRDHYLLFLHKYVSKKYIRPGGAVSFVVPDPFLCRENARAAREKLLDETELESLVHARGFFPEAGVANAVFVGRRPRQGVGSASATVVRLETQAECRRFLKGEPPETNSLSHAVPVDFFRSFPGKEFRYLLAGPRLKVAERLDTTRPPQEGCGVVIRSLGSLARGRSALFRGEEIGKEAVRSLAGVAGGDLPILIGGESIARYALRDDGFLIPRAAVRKDPVRYRRQKILLQKSAGRLVAALDKKGFVFPQSVYGVLIDDPRVGYPFLLTQLNSRLLNFYLHVMFTGYKLVQPQIEIEEIRRLPVVVPEFEEPFEARRPALETAKGLYRRFLETDDPGWVTEYLEESLKLGAPRGSALIHDLLDFLGERMIEASAGGRAGGGERTHLEWLIDLLIYRIFGLDVEEVELVEGFFDSSVEEEAGESAPDGEAAENPDLAVTDPERRDPSVLRRGSARLFGGGTECTS